MSKSAKKKTNENKFSTNNPFGFISYNSETFLSDKLNDLIDKEKLRFWSYIHHKGEYNKETLTREKEHFHVRVVPMESIAINTFEKEFDEFVSANELPLGIHIGKENMDDSIFGHWYLYSIHDEKYLNSKGLKKEFLNYSPETIKSSNQETLKEMISNIDYSIIYRDFNMKQWAKEGKTTAELLDNNLIKVSDVYDYERLLKVYADKRVFDLKYTKKITNCERVITKYNKKWMDAKYLLHQYENEPKERIKQVYLDNLFELLQNFEIEIIDENDDIEKILSEENNTNE